MPLSFQNLYTETAYVALLWFDAGCSPDPWRKFGWYAVAPGQTLEVIDTDFRTLQDPNFAWFADTGADGPCWSGQQWYKVPHNAAFNQCYDDDTGCNALWPFRAGRLDTEWLGFTIMLLGPGNPNQANQGCVWGNPQYPPVPTRGPVPDVTGQEAWQARSTLHDAGFSSECLYDGDPCTGKQQGATVQSQSPPANSIQPFGIIVKINCSY